MAQKETQWQGIRDSYTLSWIAFEWAHSNCKYWPESVRRAEEYQRATVIKKFTITIQYNTALCGINHARLQLPFFFFLILCILHIWGRFEVKKKTGTICMTTAQPSLYFIAYHLHFISPQKLYQLDRLHLFELLNQLRLDCQTSLNWYDRMNGAC